MKQYDVVVIGGGLAGLMAAITAAGSGKKVALLQRGAGMLGIGGGIVDLLGYEAGGKPVRDIAAAIGKLDQRHPYAKIGAAKVQAAAEALLRLAREGGYAYAGDGKKVRWVISGAGTLKPTGLLPSTMDITPLKESNHVYILGIEGMKDHYPALLQRGLKGIPPFAGKEFEVVQVRHDLSGGRDVSNLDLARRLDQQEGRDFLVKQLKERVPHGATVICPPILGTTPDYAVAQDLQRQTGCKFVETATVPPAITGIRLRGLLLKKAKSLGVTIIENAEVVGADVQGGRCRSVATGHFDRLRHYGADSFILAAGGFYGGGLTSEPGKMTEAIFGLPIRLPGEQVEEWSNARILSEESHAFTTVGVEVDERLLPVDDQGKRLLDNVYIAGRSLAGYDFCTEKSGNGVALATGYAAGLEV